MIAKTGLMRKSKYTVENKKSDSPEDLLKELTELRSTISRANELAISGQAAIA